MLAALRSRALLLVLAVVLGGASARAQTTLVLDGSSSTADRTFAANDATRDNVSLIVRGITVTINGAHSFANLTLESGGILTHDAGLEAGMSLTVAGDANVKLGTSINVNGRGYAAGQGPGGGAADNTGGSGGGGASYGGEGTAASVAAGPVYGSVKTPNQLGSGGGSGYSGANSGGSGGGLFQLNVSGNLIVDGQISSNGNDAYFGGAGSGGGIQLRAGTFSGSGAVTAYGGYGSADCCYGRSGGGGGGGRIAVYFTGSTFIGAISAAGNGSRDRGRGGAGTVFLKSTTQSQGDLVVDNNGNGGAGTVLPDAVTFDNIKVRGAATLTPPYQGVLDVTALGSCIVEQGALITASGRGFGAGQGLGRGANDNTGSSGGAGGSYGGEGTPAAVSTNAPYGSVKNPLNLGQGENLGSGGGSGYNGGYGGGAGGGAIRLTVHGSLQIDGKISVNGNDAYFAGGGAGGSIYLNVGSLAGAGTITAYGGYGSGDCCYGATGGGGGGGRIAVYYDTNAFTGVLSAAGGGSRDRGRAGAGTVFLQQTVQTQGDLWVQNDGVSGRSTVLAGPATFDNVRVFGKGILSPPYGGQLTLTILGNCTIENTGYISGTGRGYGPQSGPGKGSDTAGGNAGGGGGGYGGAGGVGSNGGGAGGGTYGSETNLIDPATQQLYLGSGGGVGNAGNNGGANGGGAIRLTVNGALQVDGDLEVDGNGSCRGGAGSGGSLLLRIGQLTGIGHISANGGYGNCEGGSGGGGRLALYDTISDFTGTVTADGGGNNWNGPHNPGTVHQEQASGNFTVTLALTPASLASGQSATGVITLSSPAPSGGLTVALGSSDAAAAVPPSVTIPEGQTTASFGVTAGAVAAVKVARISVRLFDQVSFVDLTVRPFLGALSLNPASVNSGGSSTGALTLGVAAPAGGLTVALSTDDANVSVPAALNLAAGTTSATFPVTVGAVSGAKAVNIKAAYLSETVQAALLVNPAGVGVKTLAVAPASVVGGASAFGVVTLDGPAPAGGALVALSTSDAGTAAIPTSVLVTAGHTSAALEAATHAVASPVSVFLSATLGVAKTTTLTVRPPGIASLALLPASVTGGENAVGVVTLDAVSAGPVIVAVSSSKAQAVPDATFVVPAGKSSAAFNVETAAVTSATLATLTAKANGVGKSQTLTLNPRASGQYTMLDVQRAMQLQAGLAAAGASDISRLDVAQAAPSANSIGWQDTVLLVRKVVGLEPNP